MSNQKEDRGRLPRGSLSSRNLADYAKIFAVALPIIATTALHFVIGETDKILALDYQNPAVYQFYTAAYVHATTSHLLGNLVGYLIAVLPLYALYTHQDRGRSEFLGAFVFVILAVPVIANVASYLTWSVVLDLSIQYGRGLSGVVAAFVGLLLIRTFDTYDKELPEENAIYAASIVGITLFATWAVMFRGLNRVVALVMLGLVLVLVIYTSWKGNFSAVGIGEWAQENRRLAVILFVGTFAAVYMVVVTFPADLQNQGGFTNLVGHGAGFFSGMAVHYYQSR
jgi:hypothetical protein